MESESSNIIVEMGSALWNVWKEMFGAFWEVAPTAFFFILWVLSAIVILPCVFIAGTLYPMWVKWGEDSF